MADFTFPYVIYASGYINPFVPDRPNPKLIYISSCMQYAICNIGGSACEAVDYFNRSLRSCYFVCVVNERASFASFTCAVEGAR